MSLIWPELIHFSKCIFIFIRKYFIVLSNIIFNADLGLLNEAKCAWL